MRYTDSMRKPVKFRLAILLLVGAGALVWKTLHIEEPVYQGKRLSGWLADLDLNGRSPDQARQAVRAIGTNSFPVLLRMLSTKDPLWKKFLIALSLKQSIIEFRFSQADVVRCRAVEGYAALGEVAKDGVPALIQMMDSEICVEVRIDTAAALGAIGPSAKAAIPALLKAAGDPNPELRKIAIFALMNIRRWDLESARIGF
jgi:hypothetical protein